MEFVDFMPRGEENLIDRATDFLIEIGLHDRNRLPGIGCDGVGDYGADECIVIDIEKYGINISVAPRHACHQGMDVAHMGEVFIVHVGAVFAGDGEDILVVQQEVYIGAQAVINQGDLFLRILQLDKGGIFVALGEDGHGVAPDVMQPQHHHYQQDCSRAQGYLPGQGHFPFQE